MKINKTRIAGIATLSALFWVAEHNVSPNDRIVVKMSKGMKQVVTSAIGTALGSFRDLNMPFTSRQDFYDNKKQYDERGKYAPENRYPQTHVHPNSYSRPYKPREFRMKPEVS